MCLHPLLPNELLLYIIEYIAYTPQLPWAPDLGDLGLNSSFHRPSPELLALSAANWQLRRACLSFLFERIRIRHDGDAKKLENHLAICAKITKYYFFTQTALHSLTNVCRIFALVCSRQLTRVGVQIVFRIFPQLEQLLDVKLVGACWKTPIDLNAVRIFSVHPTITPVLADGIPHVILNAGLCRAKSIGQEWHVKEFTLRINPSHSLIEILSLLASSFPKLEILSLELESDLGKYHISGLCSAFAQFPSLRVVYVEDILYRLPFGSEVQNLISQGVDHVQVHAKRELLAFTSCLAKQVRTLESVYILDGGYDHDDDGIDIQLWWFKGWLHVLDSDRRDISETFVQ
ncbi:hypothetical protein EV361DRAFT_944843 [Lentinula raphanica]|uniref:F-box domain-containing protein n=1 Tax=Lentinula raphanica TaxID=153919 RepID=A0AA38PEZ3_9AGAR|nr:hypothetical protein F5878DRAFT_722828 [Lentinula raphanica]KAJ3976954.1 hypothetical protein EV361DRAFT_944843 [Lentinula raphanica]